MKISWYLGGNKATQADDWRVAFVS